MRKVTPLFGLLILLFPFSPCLAATWDTWDQPEQQRPTYSATKNGDTPIEERADVENKIPPNYFAIAFYKPTYILPYYYTGSPYNSVYQNNTPNNESLKSSEFKYQFSVKVPIWKDIFDRSSSLFLAYTQLSYWQLYNKRAFFRESDYEPELFLANEWGYPLFHDWKFSFFNVGAVHQSNGFGNELERSWNRAYVEAIFSSDNSMISVKPWYILSTYNNNENIGSYLGYGQLLFSYKYHEQVFSLLGRSLFESGGRRATAEFTWSFPITSYIKGYAQVFSGYGQSLIEYDHRTNSAGIGIAFSDWI